MTSFPSPAFVNIDAGSLAVYEAAPVDPAAPVIVFVHGWPEIAYSWKHQLPALAAAGYRAVAPDLKGFGRSATPADPSVYDIRHLTDDLARLLDGLGVEKAIFCGHDWGGAIVWPMAQLQSDRVAGVIGVCTPHLPPPPAPPLSIIKKRYGDSHYFIQFQEDGAAETLFESDVERFFKLMFRSSAGVSLAGNPRVLDLCGRFRDGPAPIDDDVIIAKEDLQVFIDAYRQSGFRGGVNLYRNIDRNWEIMKDRDPVIPHTALWIGASDDLFLPPETAEGIEKLVPNIEKQMIEDCGHWVMWEQPDALNKILLDWLKREFPLPSSE